MASCTPASLIPSAPTVRKDSDAASTLTDTTPVSELTERPLPNSDSARKEATLTGTTDSEPSARR